MLFIEGSVLDKFLHITALLLAIGLAVISFLSYVRDKRKKILYVAIAFALFAIKEFVTSFHVLYINDPIIIFLAHTLNIIILILFFLGVVL